MSGLVMKQPNEGKTTYVQVIDKMERETGFEPATLALARRCSTTELFPLSGVGKPDSTDGVNFCQANHRCSSGSVWIQESRISKQSPLFLQGRLLGPAGTCSAFATTTPK